MYKNLKKIIIASIISLPTINALAADYKLNRYAATPEKWNTNSYWLESSEGIVLIDAQLLIEDAILLAAMIKSTGKPVKGAIITHAHPDHFGGLNTLQKELGKFPVYSSKATAATFEPMREQALNFTSSIFGDRYDTIQITPDHVIDGKGEIELAGITFVIEDIGPGESMNATLVYEQDQNILFSGDATMHYSHMFSGESRSEEFLRQLHYIKTEYKDVEYIYAGHGDPARTSHLDAQISYIEDIRKIAKKAIQNGNYKSEDGNGYKQEVIKKYAAEIVKLYPGLGDYGISDIEISSGNIEGVITEMTRK